MARRLNMAVVFAVMAALAAPILQMSAAQTTHVVGGALGWTVPPGGPIAYSTWAAGETFTVSDVLVFNFTTGVHDVAKVTKAAFDSCNSSGPISHVTTGPANVTLDVAGDHYFICTVGSHCNLGQKLAINVTAASSSPAPQPTTPSPQSAAPAPVPSTTATPPSTSATPPSTTATPPTSSATPPSTTAIPPTSSATPPSTTATPPSTSTSPPSPTTPATPSPAGTTTPPTPENSAPSSAAVGFPAVFLSIAVALLY